MQHRLGLEHLLSQDEVVEELEHKLAHSQLVHSLDSEEMALRK